MNLRPVLLCIAVILAILVFAKNLLSHGSLMAGLPRSFIEWCVATYNPKNAEEVADMEIVIAVAISTIVTSLLISLALLLRKRLKKRLNYHAST